jgi:hypothetical protein
MMDEVETSAESGAAEAFAALQSEVAELGERINALADRTPAGEVIDYGPSFGEIQRQLGELQARISGIADYPSLRLTPDQHARAIERAKDGAFQEVIRQLRDEAGAIRRERELLEKIGMQARNPNRQRLWFAGALLGGLLAYPLAAAIMPGGSYLAAIAAGSFNRWQAGAGLMQAADPEGARSIARATRIVSANAEALKGCADAARKAGKEVKCAVAVEVE